jgi:hypothetical protein
MDTGGAVIGFCEGGDPAALQHKDPRNLDVLVSHEGPWGFGTNTADVPRGSRALLEYLEVSRPHYHVFGHLHYPIGPLTVHDTQCIQVASVVSNPRDPTLQVIKEGCIGTLDTETGDFEFVKGAWLGTYQRKGGFQLLADAINKKNGIVSHQATQASRNRGTFLL